MKLTTNRLQQWLIGGGLCALSPLGIYIVLREWDDSVGYQALGLALIPAVIGIVFIALMQVMINRDTRIADARDIAIREVAVALFDAPAKVYSASEGIHVVAEGEAKGTKLRVALERGESEVALDARGLRELDESVLNTPARKRIRLTERGLILRGPPNLDDAKERRDLLLEVRDELEQLETRKALPDKGGYR